MKENVFTQLGFEKVVDPTEQRDGENEWYYYTLDIGDLSLLTPASDEIVNNEWYCYLFEIESFKITEEKDLVDLVNLLTKIYKPCICGKWRGTCKCD